MALYKKENISYPAAHMNNNYGLQIYYINLAEKKNLSHILEYSNPF